MRHKRMRLPAILTVALVLAACGGTHSPTDQPTPETAPPTTTSRLMEEPSSFPERDEDGFPPGLDRPPPVVVRNGETVLTLEAWTACYGNGCYDGMPPPDPPSLGSPAEILVEFPEPGWEFTATVTPVDEECGRRQTELLQPVDGTTSRLTPIGFADEYEVTLFGRGPGGDLLVTFVWSSPTDGVMPVPKATAAILAGHDGRVDSYGVEIQLWNLADTPAAASGTATVTSANGAAYGFSLARQDIGCSVGSLFLTAPVEEGLAAAQSGSPPFTYTITTDLDGKTYVGTGVWPDQEDPECAPCVPLEFNPPLPALQAGD